MKLVSLVFRCFWLRAAIPVFLYSCIPVFLRAAIPAASLRAFGSVPLFLYSCVPLFLPLVCVPIFPCPPAIQPGPPLLGAFAGSNWQVDFKVRWTRPPFGGPGSFEWLPWQPALKRLNGKRGSFPAWSQN